MRDLKNPFSLLRHAISHATFEDSNTRHFVMKVIDEIEDELDSMEVEFEGEKTLASIEELQTHLVELLVLDEGGRDEEPEPERRSVGEIETDEEDEG